MINASRTGGEDQSSPAGRPAHGQGWARRLILPAGPAWPSAILYRGGPLAAGVVAATGLVAAVLVPFGAWRPQIVLPVLVLITLGLLWLVRLVPVRSEPGWSVLAIVAISAGHTWWAAATHAEHVVLRRDAGSYALYTQWISTHHGLPVDAPLTAFGGSAALADPAFRLASPAFFSVLHGAPGAAGTTADIVPQFLLGAPALFSLGWWTAGWQGLFVTPAILSGLAMLALAGLAARMFGARWAVLAVAVLAVAQPMLHAARSTYSEPAATILVAAAAALLMDAVRGYRPERPGSGPRLTRGLMLAAGLTFGLAGLVRVDALREVSLVFPVAAVLALRARPLAAPLVTGALGGTATAAIPALLLSRPYLGQLVPSLVPLIGAGVVLGAGSLIAVRLVRSRNRVPATVHDHEPLHDHEQVGDREQVGGDHARLQGVGAADRLVPGVIRQRPAQAAAGLVALAGLVLASRPLWTTTRQSPDDPGSRVVAGLQQRQGLSIDGGRTYAEHSLNWISWYLGPICVVLAWIMFSALAYAAVSWWRQPRGTPGEAVPAWLGPAAIGLGSLILTLYRPGITPDHPWADRRMVPIVLPAFVLAATALIALVVRRLDRDRRPLAVAAGALGVLALLLPAWLGTAPLATASTERGEVGAVDRVCAALRPGDVVVSVDSRAANEWPQLIRGVCGYPAASLKAAPDAAVVPLARITARIRATGHHPVLLAALPEGVDVIAATGLRAQLTENLRSTEDQRLLTRRPDAGEPLAVQVWLARDPS